MEHKSPPNPLFSKRGESYKNLESHYYFTEKGERRT